MYSARTGMGRQEHMSDLWTPTKVQKRVSGTDEAGLSKKYSRAVHLFSVVSQLDSEKNDIRGLLSCALKALRQITFQLLLQGKVENPNRGPSRNDSSLVKNDPDKNASEQPFSVTLITNWRCKPERYPLVKVYVYVLVAYTTRLAIVLFPLDGPRPLRSPLLVVRKVGWIRFQIIVFELPLVLFPLSPLCSGGWRVCFDCLWKGCRGSTMAWKGRQSRESPGGIYSMAVLCVLLFDRDRPDILTALAGSSW